MGKVKWGGGVSAQGIDDVDTSKQFTPYAGPTPPNGVYQFHLKIARIGESKQGNPQLILGLELVPRKDRPEDRRYKGYFLMDYIPVMESTQFRVRPFLDAIGVSGKDFVDRTVDDGSDKKNITKIGKWVQNGKQYVLVSIGMGSDQAGNSRMEAKSYVPAQDLGDTDDDAADDTADNDDDEPPF